MRARLAAVALLATFTAANSAVIHVATTGVDTNSGANWARAKRTIGNAIAAAAAGDQIWVASGVYPERIRNKVSAEISVDMALYGGFAGTESSLEERDIAANATILDGGGTGPVITIDALAGPGMRIDGFRIRNGDAMFGGGIQVTASAPTIENNDILGCQADHGGGIMIWGFRTIPPVAHARIVSNVIQVNRGGSGGGGIAIVGASPEVRGNVVMRNTTGGTGGGIGVWVTQSSKVARPRIVGNLLFENAANLTTAGLVVGGGGVFATERNLDGAPVDFGVCTPTIEDNLIAANAAIACGGGIAIVNADTESAPITNNTVVGNSGSGICWGNAGPTVVNNLVASNTWGLEQDVGNPVPATVRFNDVWGNSVHGESTDYFGLENRTGIDGNLSVDPGIARFGIGRLRLQPDSPCIDAGDDAAVGSDRADIDGQPRVLGSHVDIGADESDGTIWADLPAIVRVGPDGDDGDDGSSWALAMETVQAAIDAVWAAGGGEVWVREGTYPGGVTLSAWVEVYGGFDGTEIERTERDPALHATVLDGGGVPPVVSCGLSGYRVGGLDGFRITGGGTYTGGLSLPPPSSPAGQGGGVRCAVSSPVLSGNDIVENSLGDPFTEPLEGPGVGGGISLIGSHALVVGNRIVDNEVLSGSGLGGGVYCEWSVVDVWDNTIETNHAPAGSGVYCIAARPMLSGNAIRGNENYYLPPAYFGSSAGAVVMEICWDVAIRFNTFVANVADVGGALYLDQPERGTVAGNLFVGNEAYSRQLSTGGEGGAIWVLVAQSPEEPLEILGNTFVDNTATGMFAGEQGGALAVLPLSSEITIGNNVMAFNSSGIYRRPGFTASPVLSCNGMYNGTANYVGLSAGATDVEADPRFVDRPAGDHRLGADSPMVEAGDPACVATAVDLDGAPRVQDADYDGTALPDIGAYELSPDRDLDGTPDWLDDDDDDDGVDDAADCAPLDREAWTLPVPVDAVRVERSPTILSWTAQGVDVRYDVAAGRLSELRADAAFDRATCESNDGVDATWEDDEPDPPAGEARYYLVRADNACGDGGWGVEREVTACP